MTDIIIEKNFNEIMNIINDKYLKLLNILVEKFKDNESLFQSLHYDLSATIGDLKRNKYYVLNIITKNLLFTLEHIYDYNFDYFIYQKVSNHNKKSNHKKNYIKIGIKTNLKQILKNSDNNFNEIFFKNIIEIFNTLLLNNDAKEFHLDYIHYVKNNFSEDKNYGKMLLIFDNLDYIINKEISENEDLENEDLEDKEDKEDKEEDKKKNKKGKDNKENKENDFLKNLENSKIGQLAKNISEKVNFEEYPELNDPSKLFQSFLGGNENNGEGIQNLLKLVMGEVDSAFQNDNLNQNDFMGEAMNLMGQIKNISGIDPMEILKNIKK